MILEDVLCDLRERLLASGYVNEFYEYCTLVKQNGITRPEYYIGGGQFQPVHDFDANGAGYARKRSETIIEVNDKLVGMTGCETDNQFLNITYPLRAVFGVPRTKLGDNAYSSDLLFNELALIFGGSYSVNNASEIATSIVSYNTDPLSIWSQEVQGEDHQMTPELCYIAVNFDLTFTVNIACMEQVCGYGY